jgi:UDP-N-acetylmuramoylalanine--D-glutamate ligase
MIRAETFANRAVALFGLGGSGRATAAALLAGGATVSAWDDNPDARTAAQAAGIPVSDLATDDWSAFSALVLSPGVPLTHPEPHWTVARARAAGVEIIGDIEIFARERAARCPDAPFIAITGTNGKSTTTALTAHLLRAAGRDVQMGGNIGTPILALEPPAPDRFHVIEMSSFQIDLTPTLSPSIGVLINLSPDHIDRHGTFERYAAIKERLVANAAHPIVGEDDEECRTIAERLRLTDRTWVDRFSAAERISSGWYADGTSLISRAPWAGLFGPYADLAGIGTLRGRHNAQNALAATIAALQAGATAAQVAAALPSYPGLAHRLEEIGRLGRTLFINDSKATNADSTDKALAAFSGGIHWILGGKPKEGGIASLTAYFPRIARAYLIGQAADDFARTLDGRVPYVKCGTLDRALAAAAADAAASTVPEPVVLLSPACASYDQFKSFEHRGQVFRDLVSALPGIALRPRSA